MSDRTMKGIRLVFGIVLSAVTAAAGICLMAACLSIYRSGPKPFSPESVASAFAPIALPVYLCLALVVLGFLLDFFRPAHTKHPAPGGAPHMTLARLWARTDEAALSPEVCTALSREKKGRRIRTAAGIVLLVIGTAVYLPYGLDIGNFPVDGVNGAMIRAMWLLLPCMGIPFAWAVAAAFLNRASLRREIGLLQSAGAFASPSVTPKKHKNAINTARVILLMLAAALLLVGLFSGGAADVLTKAVNICTECIGLG